MPLMKLPFDLIFTVRDEGADETVLTIKECAKELKGRSRKLKMLSSIISKMHA